jgi:Zn ribbon nucleic-acid-binding protein
MPRPKIPNPVIATAECSACSTVVDVQVTSGGKMAYYTCPNCKHFERWGAGKTKELFLNQQQGVQHGEKHKIEEINTSKESEQTKLASGDKPEQGSGTDTGTITRTEAEHSRTEGGNSSEGNISKPEPRPDNRKSIWGNVWEGI